MNNLDTYNTCEWTRVGRLTASSMNHQRVRCIILLEETSGFFYPIHREQQGSKRNDHMATDAVILCALKNKIEFYVCQARSYSVIMIPHYRLSLIVNVTWNFKKESHGTVLVMMTICLG